MCDTCSRVYHLDCLDPPLKTIPKGMWICPRCQDQVLWGGSERTRDRGGERPPSPVIWGNSTVSSRSGSSPGHVCHTYRTSPHLHSFSSPRSSVHEAVTHVRRRSPNCFSLFEMMYLFITVTLKTPQYCLLHSLKMVQT